MWFSLTDTCSRARSRFSAPHSRPTPTFGKPLRCRRKQRLTHFDLSIVCADFKAWLWVHSWPVKYTAIFQGKSGRVVRTHNAVFNKPTLRKGRPKVRTCVGHGKETVSATDEKNRCVLIHRLGWRVVG